MKPQRYIVVDINKAVVYNITAFSTVTRHTDVLQYKASKQTGSAASSWNTIFRIPFGPSYSSILIITNAKWIKDTDLKTSNRSL